MKVALGSRYRTKSAADRRQRHLGGCWCLCLSRRRRGAVTQTHLCFLTTVRVQRRLRPLRGGSRAWEGRAELWPLTSSSSPQPPSEEASPQLQVFSNGHKTSRSPPVPPTPCLPSS